MSRDKRPARLPLPLRAPPGEVWPKALLTPTPRTVVPGQRLTALHGARKRFAPHFPRLCSYFGARGAWLARVPQSLWFPLPSGCWGARLLPPLHPSTTLGLSARRKVEPAASHQVPE